MKLTLNKVFFGVFALVWAGLLIGNGFALANAKPFSETENRYLATLPKFSWATLLNGNYMMDLEEYANDHFIMRDRWITANILTERLMLKTDSNGVYFAEDGYLIEKHDPVDQVQMEKNLSVLNAFIQSAADRLGSDRISVMLVPTASEVLQDKLPPFAVRFDQAAFGKHAAQLLPEGVFVDVLPILDAHKDEYIFYRTDHHWTALGAYYAYVQWAQRAGVQPLSMQEFEVSVASDSFYGTLHSKVNLNMNPDTLHLYQIPGREYHLTYNMSQEKDGLFDMSALEGKDKYSVYLGGNNALVKIESQADNDRKLLVIKDSFAHSFVPFVADHFAETHMVDLRYFNMSVNRYMEENGITDVLVLYNTMNFTADRNLAKLSFN